MLTSGTVKCVPWCSMVCKDKELCKILVIQPSQYIALLQILELHVYVV
jgi:hypothetical protein